MATIKTLLVVEQSDQMRRLIRMLIGDRIEHIVECADASQALAAYANCRADWVLMDINIKPVDPDNAGATALGKPADAISITRRITQLFPGACITILADYDEPDLREAAHRAGASGYLVKDDLSSLPALLTDRLTGLKAQPEKESRDH
jgi:DNA-binding NarL/FixJ family response regulator